MRKPILLRHWLLVLLGLWLIWMITKPDNAKKFDSRIEAAIAQSVDCKLDEARAELASLKSAKATAEQLKRLHKAINDATPSCERRQARTKAWGDTVSAVDAALTAASFELARARLGAFTRRWGEGADTRELKTRIDARQAEKAQGPGATVQRIFGDLIGRNSASAPQAGEQSQKIIAEAEREIAQGNYKAAIDKMDVCAMLVDNGAKACLVLKQKAERLNGEMQRCLAAHKDWINDRCE